MHYSLAVIDLQSIRDAIAAADAAGFRAVNTGLGAKWLDPVMIAITSLGIGYIQAAIALAVVLAGFVKRRVDLRRMGYAALVAFAASGIPSQIIKHIEERPRPTLLVFDIRLPAGPLWTQSFPSGHTTTAFAAAFAFAAFLPRWRWAFYTLAALVGLSRMYLGVHFPVDVIFGALFGSFIGVFSARIFRPKPAGEAK